MTAAASSRTVPARGYGVKAPMSIPGRRRIPAIVKTAISRRLTMGPWISQTPARQRGQVGHASPAAMVRLRLAGDGAATPGLNPGDMGLSHDCTESWSYRT